MDSAGLPALRRSIPLSRRRLDWILLAFFAVNLFFITLHVSYPLWPAKPFADLMHSYGKTYDPLLMARPAFWRMTIWIDMIWNGPFYLLAVYAISRGRDWIRTPALVWCGSMTTVVLIVLAEEYDGVHAAPNFGIVLALNLPWLLLPLLALTRVARNHPFTEPVPVPVPASTAQRWPVPVRPDNPDA